MYSKGRRVVKKIAMIYQKLIEIQLSLVEVHCVEAITSRLILALGSACYHGGGGEVLQAGCKSGLRVRS